MRYQICVSGAATGDSVLASRDLAFRLGQEIVRQGKILTTGAVLKGERAGVLASHQPKVFDNM